MSTSNSLTTRRNTLIKPTAPSILVHPLSQACRSRSFIDIGTAQSASACVLARG
jgi:hypothetical protein